MQQRTLRPEGDWESSQTWPLSSLQQPSAALGRRAKGLSIAERGQPRPCRASDPAASVATGVHTAAVEVGERKRKREKGKGQGFRRERGLGEKAVFAGFW